MRQALHIFRKDTRHLWLQITVVLLLTIAFGWTQVLSSPLLFGNFLISRLTYAAEVALPISWWLLTAFLVHQENLLGDRQFWLTRPYRRTALFGAKVLFLVTYVEVPLFLTNCVILAVQNFSVFSKLPSLLLQQLIISVILLLPFLVIASITNGLGQFLFAGFLVFLGVSADASFWHEPITGTEWIQSIVFLSLLFLLCAVILWMQYSKRRTALSRTIAPFLLVLPAVGLPLNWRIGIQNNVLRPPFDIQNVQLRFEPQIGKIPQPPGTELLPPLGAALPIEASGLPAGIGLLSTDARFSISAGGVTSCCEGMHAIEPYITAYAGHQWLVLSPRPELLHFPVNIRGSLILTAVKDSVVKRVSEGSDRFTVPGFGSCRFISEPGVFTRELLCRTDESGGILYPNVNCEPEDWKMPVVAWRPQTLSVFRFWGLSPVSKWTVSLGSRTCMMSPTEVEFVRQEPVAIFRKDFEADGVDLRKYMTVSWP